MTIRKRWGRLVALSAACVMGAGSQAQAADSSWIAQLFFALNSSPPAAKPAFKNKLLARAKPDECFDGIGNPYPPISQDGTCSQGQPKTNEAYIWGLTREKGGKLWFGTAPNVICLVNGGYFGSDDPSENESWVCEFGESQYSPPLPAILGDFRPPNAYEFNPKTGKLTKRTPAPDNPKNLGLFQNTLGIRSAGSIGGVSFLAGPDLDGSGANFFAFKVSDGSLIASCKATGYDDIRSWVQYKGVLHAGIGTATDGAVIKWTGTEGNPFKSQTESADCGFETVATLPGSAAYVTTFGSDRLAVSAWPADFTNPSGAGTYLVNPANGSSTLLWKPSDYEPDPVVAATYGGGAIVEWKGALYFMTMHVPGLSAVAHASCNLPICAGPPSGTEEQLQLFLGTLRSTSLWRINNPKSAPTVELLYGESQLPAFDSTSSQFAPEPTGFTPKFGRSGFGNPANAYGWTAAVANGKLLLGTFDMSYLLTVSLSETIPDSVIPYELLLQQLNPAQPGLGADLWRFDQPTKAAIPENLSGLGNYLNYGVRSMAVSADGKTLFAGTANPMNFEAKGGWELRSLKPK